MIYPVVDVKKEGCSTVLSGEDERGLDGEGGHFASRRYLKEGREECAMLIRVESIT